MGPNVPNLPGVPPLLRPFGSPVILPPPLAVADTPDLLPPSTDSQWGIFFNGLPVVLADNVIDFAFRQDYEVSTYPQEAGAFQSYNKVEVPYDVKVSFSGGGSDAKRQAFLSSILAIVRDLNLYDVVTPELIFSPVNITHADFRRASSNGVGLIVVEVWLVQIRIAVAPTFTQTKTPSGVDKQNGGIVVAVGATPVQQSALSSIVGN